MCVGGGGVAQSDQRRRAGQRDGHFNGHAGRAHRILRTAHDFRSENTTGNINYYVLYACLQLLMYVCMYICNTISLSIYAAMYVYVYVCM